MQEKKKKDIVIASVLKPVDDTRAFEKFGATLAEADYRVHIFGVPTSVVSEKKNIFLYPLNDFNRLSAKRFISPIKLYLKWRALKPDFVIVSSHELLAVAVLSRFALKSKIIYDIRENYYRNIKHTHTFHFFIRYPLACFVRLKEITFSVFFHHFILAETNYVQELKFLPLRKTVIENKFKISSVDMRNKNTGYSRLLFSGTLAVTTGIFEVIEFVKKLHTVDPSIHLTIVGYCSQQSVLNKLLNEIRSLSYITLKGGDKLVPHQYIINEILQADYGIIWYPYNKSTYLKTPTKFFEYASLGLKILSPQHLPFSKKMEEKKMGLLFDYSTEAESILEKMKNHTRNDSVFADVWENEERKLLDLIGC